MVLSNYSKKITVLVVDDSKLMRVVLSDILNSDPDLEVIGTAEDPYDAREKIKALNPDVMTLDIQMPKMDGISFLNKVMSLRPMPVVMVSTLTESGADVTIRALEIGAVDYVTKPQEGFPDSIKKMSHEICQKVKVAARAQLQTPGPLKIQITKPTPSSEQSRPKRPTPPLIAIGASTGGVEAITKIISILPPSTPPIVIVQHMPPFFTANFAKRLDNLSQMTVQEAVEGQPLEKGHVYVAPGGKHMEIQNIQGQLQCRIFSDAPINGHCPAVDIMFNSVAKVLGKNSLGVILTGMGKDGASGLKKIKDVGGLTWGQDESSCVVYGMPRAAKELGAITCELTLNEIAKNILNNDY